MQQLAANLFRGTFQAKHDVFKAFLPILKQVGLLDNRSKVRMGRGSNVEDQPGTMAAAAMPK